jgi:hypothetical protein
MEWGNLSALVSWQNVAIVLSAIAFAAFLLWKIRPIFPLPRVALPNWRRRALPKDIARQKDEIRSFRDAARKAKSGRERAEALTRAAAISAAVPEGTTSATGLYLRAMRADPTYGEAIRGISQLLRRERPELLDAILWRRLSELDWNGETREAARTAADALRRLYRRELRHKHRIRAMKKLVARLS